ncbi:hypothetical protein H4S02_005074 [Coemansia sp. RSA 2611]|nr:hypothetical protein H4S02_005074 [Coemansia sp. RSA 2611]
MNPVRFLVGLLVLALAVLASSLSNAERAQEYSLKLFSHMVDYVAAQARAGNPVPEIRDIPLASLGLVGPGSSAVVRDVLEGSTATAEGSLLDIPFGDVFALQPSSVRYIASLLDVLSRVDPKFAGQFAPMFGVGSNELGSPENMESVARLVATISSMESSALDMVSRATNTDMADDPLVKSGSLFALSNIVSMATTRVEHVADMFASLVRLPAPQLQLFLRDIGWQSNNILKSDDSITAIPNLSYVFPISDELLVHISDAAKAYSSDDGKLARAVQPQIKEYLRQARDFWDFIPGYSTISSVINLSNSPIVSALTDIISLSYKYPNASYWELVLQYYKNIGMPGLNALSSYPSQYVGGLASSVVGGYLVINTHTNADHKICHLCPIVIHAKACNINFGH